MLQPKISVSCEYREHPLTPANMGTPVLFIVDTVTFLFEEILLIAVKSLDPLDLGLDVVELELPLVGRLKMYSHTHQRRLDGLLM